MATKHVWLTLATLAVGAWAVAANAQSTVHLYIYDTHTGAVTQATGPMDWDPYNASFSNNGKKLVHDLAGGWPQLLGVTDLTAGTKAVVVGQGFLGSAPGPGWKAIS